MSVTINFYTNLSDKRKAVKDLTLIGSESCELKGDVDLLRPVLLIKADASTYAACNYFTIPTFNRSYFGAVRALTGGIVEVTGEVDHLSSIWPYARTKECIVSRNENSYNLMINDGTFKAYAKDQVVTKEFPSGFSSPAYVLIVAG